MNIDGLTTTELELLLDAVDALGAERSRNEEAAEDVDTLRDKLLGELRARRGSGDRIEGGSDGSR